MTCDYGCCPREVRDWFCGAGGAAMGLHRAWPHAHIVGYDIKPQKHYPFDFALADVMTLPPERVDFIWASPPCQAYTALKTAWNAKPEGHHPKLIRDVRERLWGLSKTPFVIENVPRSDIAHPFRLCGTLFGLGVKGYQLHRHRYFESTHLLLAGPCRHTGPVIGVYGQHGRDRRRTAETFFSVPDCKVAMGIDWMTGDELSQAVPPAYSQYIARQLTPALVEAAA